MKLNQRISMKAVVVNDGKVLLLRKAKYEGNGGKEGKWNNPGGRVEPGEHWQDALRREVLEETGIIIELINKEKPEKVTIQESKE